MVRRGLLAVSFSWLVLLSDFYTAHFPGENSCCSLAVGIVTLGVAFMA